MQKGDQIRRNFANWAIVYFRQFLENERNRIIFSTEKLFAHFDKNVLGDILGDFFTTSSGHPG
jgi:hypothetical protein